MEWGERVAGVLLLCLALLFALDVALRYLFAASATWIIDLEWYTGALIIMASLASTLRVDGHVRVDVIYSRFSSITKTRINRVGHLLLLLPLCVFIIYASTRYAYNSYLISEGSPDPGGLPLRWLVKFFIPVGFLLLLIEGLRQVFQRATSTTA